MFLFLSVLGCVRTLRLSEDSAETGVIEVDPTDTSNPDTSDPDPGVCVPGEASGFRIPHGRWALAVLHGSRRLADVEGTPFALSPAWFLATAWQRTGFGCAEYGEPWSAGDTWNQSGCLAVDQNLNWFDLSRMYPEYYSNNAYNGFLGEDHIEAGVMALTWYAFVSNAILQRLDDDLVGWYSAAADPYAVERVSALMHVEGVWSDDLEPVLASCSDDIEACLEGDTLFHVSGIADKLALLETAECFDAPLTSEEVTQYVNELARIWPEEDWPSAQTAALGALTGAGFSTEGPAVLDAIDSVVAARLRCPESELWKWYQLSCP